MSDPVPVKFVVNEVVDVEVDADIVKQLSDIYRDILGVDSISAHERFVDIGGNSLNLVEVIKQIEENTGITLEARLFFDKNKSTIAEISKEIKANKPR